MYSQRRKDKAPYDQNCSFFDLTYVVLWRGFNGFNGIRTHDLRDTGAMLYQLSYEATHWERGCTGIAEVTGSNPVEALIFSGFFFPIA